MVEKHVHEFAKVTANYTEPGQDALTWRACRTCGAQDPQAKRPKEALDAPPEESE